MIIVIVMIGHHDDCQGDQSDKLSASDLLQTDQDNIPDPVTLEYKRYGDDSVSSEEDKTEGQQLNRKSRALLRRAVHCFSWLFWHCM